jgi:hypothetical protein
LIFPEIEESLFRYIQGIIANNEAHLIVANGTGKEIDPVKVAAELGVSPDATETLECALAEFDLEVVPVIGVIRDDSLLRAI